MSMEAEVKIYTCFPKVSFCENVTERQVEKAPNVFYPSIADKILKMVENNKNWFLVGTLFFNQSTFLRAGGQGQADQGPGGQVADRLRA